MTKKPAANPVKQSDADAFDVFVHKWQERFNLLDWRIEKSPDAAKSALAEVKSMSLKDRLAIYKIAEDFGDTKPVTEQSLDEIACHELAHIFLHELIETAKEPGVSQDNIDSAEHRIVNVLVRLLVPGTN